MDELYEEVFKNKSQESDPVFSASLFSEYLRTKLIQTFDQIPGKKHLILDDPVRTVLNLALDGNTIKEHGVEIISNISITEHDNIQLSKVMIFVQPKVEYLDKIKGFIDKELILTKKEMANKKNGGAAEREKREFYVVYWPKRTTLCKEAQIERKIGDDQIKIIDFSFDLIPIDQDLLSLEMCDTFTSMYIDHDFSTYSHVAESIQRLQIIYGKIPNIFYKGEGPSIVVDILNANEENKGISNDYSQSEFETMILLDRNIDFITPLCQQLVYEGLIDDFYGINAALLKVDGEIVGAQKGKPVLLKLQSENNQVYASIRDNQISKAREILSNTAQEIQRIKEAIQNKKKGSSQEDIQKCLKIVDRITREQKQVEDHVNLSCSIVERMRTIEFYKDLLIEQSTILGVGTNQALEYVEMIIGLGAPIEKVLRLLCLQSLVDKGIKAKPFDEIRKQIIQEYGFKHLMTLFRLSQMGLLKRQDGSKNLWPKLKESLKLVDDEVEIDNPSDPAYAFSGYCPLTVRLVEHALKKQTWKHISEHIKNVPGNQDFPEPQKYVKLTNKSAILVYFIGGVTYGELSAIRLLAKQTNREIVIATTQLLNSKKFIQNFIQTSAR